MTQPILDAADGSQWVFDRYQEIRHRLPQAAFPAAATELPSLEPLADEIDAFVFDSFGVLNVGNAPIAGAAGRITQLRALGKDVIVLTNAATGGLASLPAKYRSLGFDFTATEIVSSREVMAAHLQVLQGKPMAWALAAPDHADAAELGIGFIPLDPACEALDRADGLILLSTDGWLPGQTDRLIERLARRACPVLVANPDLAAPRENGLSLEPGTIAHKLLDALPYLDVRFFGKPYANAFDAVLQRLARRFERKRIAMIGDTLHTDILGGAAAGLKTVLVTEHGVLRGRSADAAIQASHIVPDVIVPSI